MNNDDGTESSHPFSQQFSGYQTSSALRMTRDEIGLGLGLPIRDKSGGLSQVPRTQQMFMKSFEFLLPSGNTGINVWSTLSMSLVKKVHCPPLKTMHKWDKEIWKYNHLSSKYAMKSHVLHAVWCNITGEAAGELIPFGGERVTCSRQQCVLVFPPTCFRCIRLGIVNDIYFRQ